MNIGPDEMSGTRPIRIFEAFSCARTTAGAEATKDKAAVPVRRRRRSIFMGVPPVRGPPQTDGRRACSPQGPDCSFELSSCVLRDKMNALHNNYSWQAFLL